MTAILYPILVAALFHLGALAAITQPVWSRYPKPIEKLMTCPACMGFHGGVLVSAVFGYWQNLPFMGLPGRHGYTWIVCGLVTLLSTPPLVWLHTQAIIKISEITGAGDES
jgi:hypothetical protein